MPMCVKTVANSTLPEEAQVSSDNTSKRHDKPAVNSQSSSRASSVSSDIFNNGPPWQSCGKNRGSLSGKADKKTSLSSLSSSSQRSDSSSSRTSCTDHSGLPETTSLSFEPSRLTLTSSVKTSASASNNCKHTTSSWSSHKTNSSSTSLDRRLGESVKSGHHTAETGMVSIVSRHPPAALDTVDSGSGQDDGLVSKQQVTSGLLQRRISAPVLCSRTLSGAVNYAASVKANLPTSQLPTIQQQQQQQKQLTLHSHSLSSLSHADTISSTATSNPASTNSVTVCNTYASRASASVAKPLQDMPTSTESQQSNLVAAADSVRLILQSLGSAAAESDKQQNSEHFTTIPNQERLEEDIDSDDGSGFDQEWENVDMFSLSKDCSTDDDKISKCWSTAWQTDQGDLLLCMQFYYFAVKPGPKFSLDILWRNTSILQPKNNQIFWVHN